jgi:hypothetical protein
MAAPSDCVQQLIAQGTSDPAQLGVQPLEVPLVDINNDQSFIV